MTDTGTETPRRPSTLAVLLLLAAVVVAAYYPVFTHEFVAWDDPYHLLTNPRMNPPRMSAVGYYWAHPFFGLYIPVTYTCWTAVGILAWVPDGQGGFEVNPYVFHAANVAIHLLAAGAAWMVLNRLTRDRLAAAVGAAIFAVHPTTVESVAWVSGFRDVLGGVLSFLAIYCYVRAEEPADAETVGSRGRWIWYGAATSLFVAAILSKPASVSAAIIAGAIAVLLLKRTVRRTALLLLPWVAVAVGIAVTTSSIQRPPGAQDVPAIWQRPLIVGDSTAFYLWKLLLPTSLCTHYGRAPSWVMANGIAWKTSLAALVVAVAVVALGVRRRWVLAAGAIFVAGILPTAGILPFSYQTFSTVADRYLYFALLGPGLAVAYLLAGRRSLVPAAVVGLVAIVPLVILTNLQSRTWHSSESLFTHTLEVNPTSSIALNGLAYVRLDQGNAADAERLARTSVNVSGGDPRSLMALAAALIRLGRWEEAQPCYVQAAINGSPGDSAKALTGLANLRAEHGFADAEQIYLKALERDPTQPQARAGLERLRSRPPATKP